MYGKHAVRKTRLCTENTLYAVPKTCLLACLPIAACCSKGYQKPACQKHSVLFIIATISHVPPPYTTTIGPNAFQTCPYHFRTIQVSLSQSAWRNDGIRSLGGTTRFASTVRVRLLRVHIRIINKVFRIVACTVGRGYTIRTLIIA